MKKFNISLLTTIFIFYSTLVLYCAPKEFLVNTCTDEIQQNGDAAMNDSGDFVIAWESWDQEDNEQDEPSFGVFAQRYDKDGNKLGDEFQVNQHIQGAQWAPSVAMDDSGNFVIVWVSGDQDGSEDGVYAQRFDSEDNKSGGEFQVNTYTDSYQQSPSIAMDPSGNFVITWQSSDQDGSDIGIFAQRFDKDGNKLGSEFQVNSFYENFQYFPSIAMDDSGEFIIVWQNMDQDGIRYGVFAQRFDSNGNRIGDEFQVNTGTEGENAWASVAMNGNGDFVISWIKSSEDDTYSDVYAQMFDKNGNKKGAEFLVNTYTLGWQEGCNVVMDDTGNFLIAYLSVDLMATFYEVFAQRFDKDGNKVGFEFQVNSYYPDHQLISSAAMDSAGDFIITWDNPEPNYDLNVYAKLYKAKEINPFEFHLRLDPEQGFYEYDDNLKILVDLQTPTNPVKADLYFIMLDPAGKIYFASDWSQAQPLLKNFEVPANIRITGAELLELNIPNSKPPVEDYGIYTFAIGAAEPGTANFISNIATVSFNVE
ncbi:hypothetical protein KKB18_05620 [bacterium]|nr:hypothetical protein [bacterium]